VVVVNATYLELHVPFVRDRLKRAGIRSGHLLNTTLGQWTGSRTTMRRRLAVA
jgi:hypothetical protein